MVIAMSSGHGKYVRGASNLIDEVTEARKVTDRVAEILRRHTQVHVFHENNARTANDNVNAIVREHNRLQRDLDVSVHFNSFDAGTPDNTVERGIGVETLYHAGHPECKATASAVSQAVAAVSGLTLRRGDGTMSSTLGFLRLIKTPSILIEVCFVNSHTDVRLYRENFEAICHAVAESLLGRAMEMPPAEPSSLQSFPIDEANIRRMAELGVITTPEFWQGVDCVQWLDELLERFGRGEDVLHAGIDNGITDIETALKVLEMSGVMSSPDYWREQVKNSNILFLGQLLINIANRCLDPLHRIIWAEARSEDLIGQTAVANVVINRHSSPKFPDGIYNVIFQENQFEPTRNGAYERAEPTSAQKEAARQALSGFDHSKGALFFDSAPNSWARQNRTHSHDIGRHSFFL
ncbi:MAG: cell wall hydrolase [Defluviitaleaceae bacterium]|nr:cell wall hydrolase [Defluviitaleaceae bacterium]